MASQLARKRAEVADKAATALADKNSRAVTRAMKPAIDALLDIAVNGGADGLRDAVSELESSIAQALLIGLAQAHAAGMGLGIAEALKARMRADKRRRLAIPEAVQFLIDRAALDEGSAMQVMEQYGNNALNVTTAIGDDAEQAARAAVHSIVSQGLTGGDARRVMSQHLIAAGVLGPGLPGQPFIAGRHIETLVRTQTRMAHSAGGRMVDKSPEIADILWGYEYVTVGDDRVRAEHVAMDGMRQPVEWPGWATYTPPNGFNCRCRIVRIFADEIEEDIEAITEDADSEAQARADVAQYKDGLRVPPGEVGGTVALPDEGFGFDPGSVFPRAKWADTDIPDALRGVPAKSKGAKAIGKLADTAKAVAKEAADTLAPDPGSIFGAWNVRRDKLRALVDADDAAGLEDALKIPKGKRGTIDINTVDAASQEHYLRAKTWLEEHYPPDLLDGMQDITTKIEARPLAANHAGTYMRWKTEIELNIKYGDPAQTLVHEMTHAVEYADKQRNNAALDFLKRRSKKFDKAKGKTERWKIPGLGTARMWRDFWVDRGGAVYTGRVYRMATKDGYVVPAKIAKGIDLATDEGVRQATEIFTTGVERLFTDPLKFAKEDREFFEFVVELLQHGNQAAI